ncbi:MAG TPA: cardiolipin synthase [Luteimonas sp.]|nr:cardiolipin synthase [Luteimonas sp.]
MLDALREAWQAFTAIPHVHLYVFAIWIAYMVWLGGWIVLQKREPVATLSWLLGLAALPVVGLLVYQVFGPQKIKRHRLRRSRSRMPAEQVDGNGDHDESAELSQLGATSTGLPPSTARAVRLLVDGAAKYEALLEAIRGAREHIHLEYYICEPDSTGNSLLDALVERARAGVKVRLLLDAVGSSRATKRFFAPLLEAGGEFAWFHPARFGRIWTRTWVNMRTHRKIVVIDGRLGFTGGINITDEENDALRDDAYRDLHLRIEGDAVRLLQVVFVEDWMYATQSRALLVELKRDLPGRQPGPIPTQVLPSGPDSPWESIHRMHVSAIHAANRRVWLSTPYFVPSDAALMALTSSALAGLDVRLMVPRRSDSLLVTLAARSYFDDLLAAGVKVYEYGPRMLHTKALLVDDEFALIGSANFDHRSFRLNFELSVLFHDAQIAGELAQLFEHDLASAPRVRDDRARPLWSARLPEALARLGSPLL